MCIFSIIVNGWGLLFCWVIWCVFRLGQFEEWSRSSLLRRHAWWSLQALRRLSAWVLHGRRTPFVLIHWSPELFAGMGHTVGDAHHPLVGLQVWWRWAEGLWGPLRDPFHASAGGNRETLAIPSGAMPVGWFELDATGGHKWLRVRWFRHPCSYW